MASAVAVVGLTYRGTDIQDLDGIFLEIIRGLTESPDVRGVDIIVPSRGGQLVRNRRADRFTIGLRGWIRGVGDDETEDRAEFVTTRAAFRALFDPTLDPGPLVATLEDGSTQTINARTLPGILAATVAPSYQSVDIELESVDPDWVASGS